MNELISLFKLYHKQSYSERENYNLPITIKRIYNHLKSQEHNNKTINIIKSNGNDCLLINPEDLQKKNFNIQKNGYTFYSSFNVNTINRNEFRKGKGKEMIIFELSTSNTELIWLSIRNNSIYMSYSYDLTSKSIYLNDIQPGWNTIYLVHRIGGILHNSEIEIRINGMITIKTIEYPKLLNRINSLFFYKNFEGSFTSIIFLPEEVSYDSININIKNESESEGGIDNLKGLYNEDLLLQYGDFLDKGRNYIKNIIYNGICIFVPNRIEFCNKGIGYGYDRILFNVINEINAYIPNEWDVIIDENYTYNTYLIGGMNIFIPLIERFSIVSSILSDKDDSKSETKKVKNYEIYIFDKILRGQVSRKRSLSFSSSKNNLYENSLSDIPIYYMKIINLIILRNINYFKEESIKNRNKKMSLYYFKSLSDFLEISINFLEKIDLKIINNQEFINQVLILMKILVDFENKFQIDELFCTCEVIIKRILFNERLLNKYDDDNFLHFLNEISNIFNGKNSYYRKYISCFDIFKIILYHNFENHPKSDINKKSICCLFHQNLENYNNNQKYQIILSKKIQKFVNIFFNFMKYNQPNENEFKKIFDLLILEDNYCKVYFFIVTIKNLLIDSEVSSYYLHLLNSKKYNLNNIEVIDHKLDLNNNVSRFVLNALLFIYMRVTIDIKYEIIQIIYILINKIYSEHRINSSKTLIKYEIFPFLYKYLIYDFSNETNKIQNDLDSKKHLPKDDEFFMIELSYFKSIKKFFITENSTRNELIPEEYFVYMNLYNNSNSNLYLDIIYDLLLKWMIDKKIFTFYERSNINDFKINNNNMIFILDEETDFILNVEILHFILKLINSSSLKLKSKFFNDLLILSNNDINSIILFYDKYFYQWLINNLYLFQISLLDENKEINKINHYGTITLLYSTLKKVHTNVIVNSIIFEIENTNQFKFKNILSELNIEINIFEKINEKLNFLLLFKYKFKTNSKEEELSINLITNNLLIMILERFENKNLIINEKNKNSLLLIINKIYEYCFFSNIEKLINEINNIDKNEILTEFISGLNYNYIFKSEDFCNQQNKYNFNNTQRSDDIKELLLDMNLFIKTYDFLKLSLINDLPSIKQLYYLISNSPVNLEKLQNLNFIFSSPLINIFLESTIFIKSNKNLEFYFIQLENEGNYQIKETIYKIFININLTLVTLINNEKDLCFWLNELKFNFILTLFIGESLRKIKYSSHSDKKIEDNENNKHLSQIVIFIINFILTESNSQKRQINRNIENLFYNTLIDFIRIFLFFCENNQIKENFKIVKTYYSKFINIFNEEGIENSNVKNLQYGFCSQIYNNNFCINNHNSYETIFSNEEIENILNINQIKVINLDKLLLVLNEKPENDYILTLYFNFSLYEKLMYSRIYNSFETQINSFQIGCYEKLNTSQFEKEIFSDINLGLGNSINILSYDIFNKLTNRSNIRRKWILLKKDLYIFKNMWNINTKKNLKYKMSSHMTQKFTRPFLTPIIDINDYKPKFTNYDIKKLFFENNNTKNNIINDINSSSDKYIKSNIAKFDKKVSFLNLNERSFELKNELNDDNIFFQIYSHFTMNNTIKNILQNLMKIKEFIKESNIKYDIKNYTPKKIPFDLCSFFMLKLKESSKIEIFENIEFMKIGYFNKGAILIDEIHNIIFFIQNFNNSKNQNHEQESSIKNLFQHYYDNSPLIIKIFINKITLISKRYYLFRNSGIEIFTSFNKSFLFNFYSEEQRSQFLKSLSLLTKKDDIVYQIISNYEGYINILVNKWYNNKFSNLEFLMKLNFLSGRSFYDLSQYPIFPWINTTYKYNEILRDEDDEIENQLGYELLKRILPENIFDTKQSILRPTSNKYNSIIECDIYKDKYFKRDLSKPIGALGPSKRKQNFLEIYEESLINTEETDGIHFYNTHFSSPIYTCLYLSRLFPFTFCAIELQGNGFDNPNRQFYSMKNTFNSCMTNNGDIRELIPEFYFLPQIFKNINNIDFGEIQIEENKIKRINDVDISSESIYKEVISNLISLEGEYANKYLCKWIDLIFGVKLKSVQERNLFCKYTYQDEINIKKYEIQNKSLKDENENQTDVSYIESNETYKALLSKSEFGQSPNQILFEKCPERILKDGFIESIKKGYSSNRLNYFKSISEVRNTFKIKKEQERNMIIHIKSIYQHETKEEYILIIYNNGTIHELSLYNSPYSESKFVFMIKNEYKFSFNENDEEFFPHIHFPNLYCSMKDQLTIVHDEGRFIVFGDFWSNKFLIFELSTQKKLFFTVDSQVSSITISKLDWENTERNNTYKKENDEKEGNNINISKNDEYLYIGSKQGKLYIYLITYDKNKNISDLELIYININRNFEQISYIDFSLDLNILLIASSSYATTYKYPSHTILNQIDIKNEILNCNSERFTFAKLSSSPLPSIILYSNESNYFFSFSINGGLIIKKQGKYRDIICPKIIKDKYFNDFILYASSSQGVLLISSLPYFKHTYTILVDDYFNIPSRDMVGGLKMNPLKFFEVSCKDMNIIYYWQFNDLNISIIKYS